MWRWCWTCTHVAWSVAPPRDRRCAPRRETPLGASALHSAGAWGLPVSRGNLLQHRLLQREVGHDPLQACVLAFQFLEFPGLCQFQAAIFLAPAVVGLFRDGRFLQTTDNALPCELST